jgi:hypothetical protein
MVDARTEEELIRGRQTRLLCEPLNIAQRIFTTHRSGAVGLEWLERGIIAVGSDLAMGRVLASVVLRLVQEFGGCFEVGGGKLEDARNGGVRRGGDQDPVEMGGGVEVVSLPLLRREARLSEDSSWIPAPFEGFLQGGPPRLVAEVLRSLARLARTRIVLG